MASQRTNKENVVDAEKEISFYFIKPSTFVEHLVAFLTFGKYSHVVLGMNRGYFIQATMSKGVVASHDLNYSADRYDKLSIMVAKDKYEKIRQFMAKQVGKRYDFLGILAGIIPMPRSEWNRWYWDGQWYCSELADATFLFIEKVGIEKHLITPAKLYEKVEDYRGSA